MGQLTSPLLAEGTHIQPMTTRRGTTNVAICCVGVSRSQWKEEIHRTIELPTHMPIVSSILFFMAIHTDVTCSAAFAYRSPMGSALEKEGKSTHNNGQKNETNKRLWNIISLCRLLDRSHH